MRTKVGLADLASPIMHWFLDKKSKIKNAPVLSTHQSDLKDQDTGGAGDSKATLAAPREKCLDAGWMIVIDLISTVSPGGRRGGAISRTCAISEPRLAFRRSRECPSRLRSTP